MASAESGDWAVRQRLSDTGERPEWLVEAIRYWPVDESPTGQSANWRILARDSSGNVFGFVASKGGATPVVAWLVSAGNGLYEVWGASIGPGGDESPARLLDKTAWAYRGGVFAVSDLMVVAADSMGGFALWWNESGLNGSKVDQAGNWSSLPVLDAQGRSDNTAFLPLHSGRLLAVWTSGRGHWPCEGTLMSAALTPGEEWSEPTPISRSCWGAYDPVVGVDPAGSVVAVWAYGTVLGSYMWSATLEN